MICPKCSSKIEDDSVFCSMCGSDLRLEVKQTPVVNSESINNTTSRENNEVKQVSSRNKSNIAQISIIIAIIGCVLFFISAEQISKVANDMIELRSQSGTSLAEVYYQDVGKALKGFAMFARALGVSVVAITIAATVKKHSDE